MQSSLIGGLIFGAISAMTGLGGIMPMATIGGLGGLVYNDFNKFKKNELSEKPAQTNTLPLLKEYAKFRFNSFIGKASKQEQTPVPPTKADGDNQKI